MLDGSNSDIQDQALCTHGHIDAIVVILIALVILSLSLVIIFLLMLGWYESTEDHDLGSCNLGSPRREHSQLLRLTNVVKGLPCLLVDL